MAKHRDDRPLVWTGLRGKDNAVVLNACAVYIARLSVQELADANAAFAAGKAPEDVLTNCRRVRLERIRAYEFQLSPLHRLTALTLIHGTPDAPRRTVLSFGVPADRDKFKVELQARLSLQPWPPTEHLAHVGLVALKYAGILAGLALATVLLALAEWKGGGHGFVALLIAFAGFLACLFTAGMAHREVRHPLLTITHERDQAAEANATTETPRDAEED